MTETKKSRGDYEIIRELLHGKRSRIVRMLIFFIIKASPVWFVPILTARMIDLAAGHDPQRIAKLIVYAVATVLLFAQNVPFHVLYIRNLSRITRGIGCDLRVQLCRQLQTLSLLYHNKTSLGKLHTKAIRDIEMIENVPRMFVEQVFQFLISVAVAITAISMRAPMALLFFIVVVPICAGFCNFFITKVRESVSEYRKSMEGMSASLNDMMKMIPITRAHGLEEQQIQIVQDQIEGVFDSGQNFDVITAFFGSASWALMGVLQVLFLSGSVYACIHGYISVGDVVMFNSFFLMLSGQLIGALSILPQLSQVRESLSSVMEILNAPDLEQNSGKRQFTAIKGAFEFRDVSFKYPETSHHAIASMSLSVACGESIAFVGPSGSGKSTVLSMLLGFIRPDSGMLLLDGNDMMQMDLRSYRHHVGVVTQEPIFFSGSIVENVAYGQDVVAETKIIGALNQANAMEFVQELPNGIHTRLGVDGVKLSGGQLQRLAIARTIIRDPKVLILDEATSALDIESELFVQQALELLMQNRTTFIVAHRVSTVRNVDRIVILHRGSVIMTGSPEELLTNENFYSKAVRQMQVGS